MPKDHVDRFLERIDTDALGIDPETEGIVDRIGGIARRIKRELETTLAEHGLAHGEWQLLLNLYYEGDPFRSSPGDLATALELSSAAMTNRLDRLEARGLVRRRPDPHDRRGVQVELTSRGRQLLEASAAAQARKEALIASVLSEREKRRLNELLRKLMLAFEAREQRGRQTR